jgi:hypothetical protein
MASPEIRRPLFSRHKESNLSKRVYDLLQGKRMMESTSLPAFAVFSIAKVPYLGMACHGP